MNLNEMLRKTSELSIKYSLPDCEVYMLVEFQDYKRVYRGGKDNLDLSFKVVERYLRKKDIK